MQSFQWYDWVRLGTIVFASIAIVRIYLRSKRRSKQYTEYLRTFVWVLMGALVALVENAVERILRNSDLSFMTGFSFVVAVYAFTALMKDEGFLKEDALNKRNTT